MKHRKIIALLLAVLVMAGALAACDSDTAMDFETGNAAPQESPMADGIYGEVAGSTTTSTAGQFQDQKLIKTVTMEAETEDLDTLLDQLDTRIGELGGYVEYRNVYNGSAYASYRNRSADLTIRIPATDLGAFVGHVEGISNIISVNESQDDVTLQYVDTQSRIEALEVEQERLLELLAKAETMSDLLEIEQRLTEVRYDLESTTSQLRVLENLVSYATVELEIREVEVLTEVEEQTVWQRMGAGFMENLRNMGQGLTDLCVWAVTYSPQLLIFAGVICLIVWLCRRSIRKLRAKRTPPPANET